MNDKTIKLLLAGIVLLLCGIAWQVGFGARPAHAQSANTGGVQPVMSTDKQFLYILRGNQLSVYFMDNDMIAKDPSSVLTALSGAGREKLLKSYKLRKLLTTDVSH